MLRVAVVDDDAQDRAKISAGLDFVAAQKDVSFSISEFDSGDQFLVVRSRCTGFYRKARGQLFLFA